MPTQNNTGGKALQKADDIMIQDPWCRAYFPKRSGVHVQLEGKDYHFCSPECRDRFLAEQKTGKSP